MKYSLLAFILIIALASSLGTVIAQQVGTLVSTTSSSANYTPTTTSVANITSLAVNNCRYTRIGNIIIGGCTFTVQATATALTQFRFTLPVISNFTGADTDVSGNCNSLRIVTGAADAGILRADTTNDALVYSYRSTNTTTTAGIIVGCVFTYDIK